MAFLPKYFSDWHLRCNVFGNFADLNESADGIFDSNNCIRTGIFHIDVEGKECNGRILLPVL